MESKIMNIFYGADNLPYKDQPRTVHFPIVGQAFMGASNTTEIRFYTDKIGSIDATYISIAKLPNGKVGTKILTKGYDAQIDENYVSLKLSNFYTQAKGDLYISLNGYEGGVVLEYNQETELYEIYGTPTIQATGSVKIAINYATQYVGDGTEETITIQDLMAELGNKLDKNSPYFVKTIDSIENINSDINKPYLSDNQVVYGVAERRFYKVELEGDIYVPTLIDISDDCLKIDGSNSMQGNLDMGQHSIVNANTIQSENIETTGMSVDYITSKSGGDISFARPISVGLNKIKNVAEPTLAQDVATKNYVDEHSGSGEVVDVQVNDNTIVDSNKVAHLNLKRNLDNATHNDIASALATKTEIDNVRDIVEGKTNSYNVLIQDNPQFDSNEIIINVDSFVDITGRTIQVSDLNTADVIFTLDTPTEHYLDRYVIRKGYNSLGAINADIPEQTYYYRKDQDLIPSANGLNIGSDDHPYSTLFAEQVYDYRNEEKVFVEDIIHKKVLVELTYDGSHILDEEGHIVGFADIKQLLDDAETYVYINDLTNKLMLNFGAYEDDALWFNSRYKIDGENYLVRLIINAQDQIQHDEDIAVNYHNAYTWSESQTFSKGFSVVSGNITGQSPSQITGFKYIGVNESRIGNSLDHLRPAPNYTLDLGTSTQKWHDLYLSGAIYSSSTLPIFCNNARTLNISQTALYAQEDNYCSLGNSNKRFKDLYLSGSANIGELRPISGTIIGVRADLRSAGSNHDIGTNEYPFKDLYLSGNITDGTNSSSVSNIVNIAHIINVNATTNAGTYHCQFQVNAPSSTTFTTTGEVASYLYDKSSTMRISASGTYVASGVKYLLTGISTQLNGSQKELVFEFINLTDGSENNISSYGLEIVDTII